MRARASLLFAGAALVSASGCADFDREDRIEDVRVLAVRTEPAELFYSPLPLVVPGAALPARDVEVQVFAFEPRGGEVTVTTRLCPRGVGACAAEAPEEELTALEGIYAPRHVETEAPDLAEDPSGRIPGLDFSYRFTAADALAFLPFSVFPEYAYFSLDVASPAHAEVPLESAFKRLPIGLDFWDPAIPANARQELTDALDGNLGIKLCDARVPDEEYVEGPTSCLEPREPNENPSLLGFRLLEADEEPADGVLTSDQAAPELGLESVIRAPRGSVIALEPVFAPGVQERYQGVGLALEDNSLFIENRREDLVASWYTTRGDASSGQSSLLLDDHFAITWALPFASASPGERDTLVLVVRDQRGGTAVARVMVEYP